MAELGYEVAQSNAAWILDKYEPRIGVCARERLAFAQMQSGISARMPCGGKLLSAQGNEHAALLIGDACYYALWWQALDNDPAAKLPVTLALASLWITTNYADSFLVHVIDSLPDVYPRLEIWVEDVLMEEGNATILTLIVCRLTVLYLRERQRRHAAALVGQAPPHQPDEQGAPVPN